ncbi:hypothetical protein CAL21_20590 [Bordetella genomosp. 4]|nr:hypothetical protein CAL21_20590 [Bordetella genomosp. 4]
MSNLIKKRAEIRIFDATGFLSGFVQPRISVQPELVDVVGQLLSAHGVDDLAFCEAIVIDVLGHGIPGIDGIPSFGHEPMCD